MLLATVFLATVLDCGEMGGDKAAKHSGRQVVRQHNRVVVDGESIHLRRRDQNDSTNSDSNNNTNNTNNTNNDNVTPQDTSHSDGRARDQAERRKRKRAETLDRVDATTVVARVHTPNSAMEP